ncbi:MAG: hypothetical protein IT370_04640 [Deltaproteobacteria bacterium]|nr:hypothetical protein [Deltaproteobacteria bacterium]
MSRSLQFVLVALLVAGARSASADDVPAGCTINPDGCNPDVAFSCDDGEPGNIDICNFEGVCMHCDVPDAQAPIAPACKTDSECDDQNPCTADSCDGECSHEPLTGTSCDDVFFCSLGDTCDLGLCQPGARATCPAAGSTCAPLVCSEMERECINAPVDEGAACDDGDSCTAADRCDGIGGCSGSRLPLCRGPGGPAQGTVEMSNLTPVPMVSALRDNPGEIEQVAASTQPGAEIYGAPDRLAGCDTGAGKRTPLAGVALVLGALAIIIIKRRTASARR